MPSKSTLPAKRKAPPGPSTPSSKKAAGSQQRALDFFFKPKAAPSPVDPPKSDGLFHAEDETPEERKLREQMEADEAFARSLSLQYAAGNPETEDPDRIERLKQEFDDEMLARKLAAQAQEDGRPKAELEEEEAVKAMEDAAPAVRPGQSRLILEDEDEDEEEEEMIIGQEHQAKVATSTSLPTPAKQEVKAALLPPRPSSAMTLDSSTNNSSEIPLHLPATEFDPHSYIPDWPNGKGTYAFLTQAFVLINETRSRLLIVDLLVNMLRMLIVHDVESLVPAVWLCTNSLAPPYVPGVELNIGPAIIGKAIRNVSGISPAALKALNNKHGDVGDVAFEAKAQVRTLVKPAPLTAKGTYSILRQIAASSGKNTQELKTKLVEKLLISAKDEEVRYIGRTLVSHLRIGAVKTTMLIALSRAFTLNKPPGATWVARDEVRKISKEERGEIFKRAEEAVKQVFAQRPSYDDLVAGLIQRGVEGLSERCPLTIGIPLKPMLGLITRDLGDMFTKLSNREFTCEYKYDGQRAQIHYDASAPHSERVSIFSRHLEVMTDKYPDLVELIEEIKGEHRSFIMEGEVVAVDKETGTVQPFQTLSNRAKVNVAIGDVKVAVCFYLFDLMLLNGEPLLEKTLRQRREAMATFKEIPNRFTPVKSIISSDQDEVHAFYQSAIAAKAEGIMVKVLDNPELVVQSEDPSTGLLVKARAKPLLATYTPDKRLESWLKVKKDYEAGADSLDLIPIGAWHGIGRKKDWWSPILLAVRNPETGTLEAVCKCMSGFTDKFYKELNEKYDRTNSGAEEDADPDEQKEGKCWKGLGRSWVESAYTPDYWFEPSEVWEIRGADITLSPVYRAGIGLISEERGLSIRFPRFMRIRDDKTIDEASTGEDIAYMYRKQEEGRDKAPVEEDVED
ncbi:ATP-dependent DNA ligase [Saitoella complicata NRRL Y-17804]|uniref:DNA ligase n=1 Tax=Saitoella complicata (strain BCRC 22490 / CBS 7301 / JCM 7358 / NBRC 10748 / NRRL Y-17804) TaxID=698492 RepID=A0A0E9NGP5_SAICN|nr:ATP-dependent DNA ligase [Saitoella complicata NRRL Y-17804]ODQ54246.1 ATP-dependent DNA ligase [Saitoella complicata NRRL Y-17804]GAO48580.1 hypothetical protein G7K_2753-t1 [Saitoella complicata NRRL Y-17804]